MNEATSRPTIAVIGTGNMGSALATQCVKLGFAVSAYNRTAARAESLRARGAMVVEDLSQALAKVDLVISGLLDAAAFRQVFFTDKARPFLKGLRVLNIAQTTPAEIQSLREEMAVAGARLSEVEIIAYPDDVLAGKGEYVLATPDEDRSAWEGLLQSLGGKVHHVGRVGRASQAEMAFWLPFAFQTVAVAYAAAAFNKENLPGDVLKAVLTGNPVLGVPGAQSALPAIMRRDYSSTQWSVANMVSSLDVVIGYANSLGLPVTVFEAVRNLYESARERGLGNSDHAAVYEVIRPA